MADEIVEGAGAPPAATTETTTQGAASAAPSAVETQQPDTLLAGGGQEPAAEGTAEEAPKTEAKWRDDWRDVMAGGDAKLRARLERFASPENVVKSWRAAEQKLSERQAGKTGLPENATPEEVATWRKENGIPDTPEGYDLSLPNGIVVGEDDKPLVGEFLKEMHAGNASPDMVKRALGAYYRIQDMQREQMAERDAEFRRESEDALRAEWGEDYRRNQNLLGAMLETHAGLDKQTRDLLFSARTADGNLLGNNPTFLKAFVQLAREVNPAATLVPGTSGNPGAAIDDEIAGYEKRMRTDRDAWFKDDKAQARYQELLQARDKLKARAA